MFLFLIMYTFVIALFTSVVYNEHMWPSSISSNSKFLSHIFPQCFIDIKFWFGLHFDEPLSSSMFGQGSRDNMSVVLVCFVSAPKVSPEAVKREAELDKYLESRVEGMS